MATPEQLAILKAAMIKAQKDGTPPGLTPLQVPAPVFGTLAPIQQDNPTRSIGPFRPSLTEPVVDPTVRMKGIMPEAAPGVASLPAPITPDQPQPAPTIIVPRASRAPRRSYVGSLKGHAFVPQEIETISHARHHTHDAGLVKKAQHSLEAHGYNTGFNNHHGATPDGVVGPKTLKAMDTVLHTDKKAHNHLAHGKKKPHLPGQHH